jgi:hypothetical protein
MRSHFRISSDNGRSWGTHVPVTSRGVEIHDANPIRRLDGNIDVYYSSVDNETSNSFTLWRRCLKSNGEQGNEELLLPAQYGNIAKVTPHRLTNNLIMLTFVEQGDPYSTGKHQILGNIIEKDSLCEAVGDNKNIEFKAR